MANQIVLKKSNQAGKAPVVGDLTYGEVALNYTDGSLYYKTSTNNIDSFSSNTATATLTNKTLTSPTVNGGTINNAVIGGTTPAAVTGTDVKATGVLASLMSAGDEGGEVQLAKPVTNTSIASGIVIDVYQNRIRFFESGGSNRGGYIDITACNSTVGTDLLAGSGGGGGSAPASMARTFMMMGA